MFPRLQRLLIVLMICIVPVQAVAVALVPVSCAGAGTQQRNPNAHSAHADAAVGVHGSPHGDDSHHSGDAAHGNLCCHHLASATASIHVLAAPQEPRVYASTVTLPVPLHIPELPQRPPRA